MSVLKQICTDKQDHIRSKMAEMPLREIKARLEDIDTTSLFKKTIDGNAQNGIALIAEIKKASPSGGVIRKDFDPAKIAASYESAGASCLSVLTDEPYFQGKDEYIALVKKHCALPVLRKDFMLSPYQIYESKLLGADCILLIMAALKNSQAEDLYGTAREIGLDILTEVHDEEELHRAMEIKAEMIGINNRNLKTLEVDLNTSIELSAQLPADVTRISESGIYTNDDIKMLQEAGFQGFLVGESLMRADDLNKAVTALLGKQAA